MPSLACKGALKPPVCSEKPWLLHLMPVKKRLVGWIHILNFAARAAACQKTENPPRTKRFEEGLQQENKKISENTKGKNTEKQMIGVRMIGL